MSENQVSTDTESVTAECRKLQPVKGFRQVRQTSAADNGKMALWMIKKVLTCYFPDLNERLNDLIDPRLRKEYSLAELIFGAIMLHLFKQKSRNAMDNQRRDDNFCKTYYRLFKLRCPSMDAVNDLLSKLQVEELNRFNASLISFLIDKRVFHRFRLLGKWFVVAVDATGVHSSQVEHFSEHVHKTSKNEVVTCMNPVLEAKLVTSNGLSIFLCIEWIVNPTEEEYHKQDCESKAFKRLALRLKEYFPRLPICFVFDGLYSTQPVMDICRNNHWQWICVFKDKLSSVHQELSLLPDSAFAEVKRWMPQKGTTLTFRWCNNLDYGKHKIH